MQECSSVPSEKTNVIGVKSVQYLYISMHTRRAQWCGKQKVFKVSTGLLRHHTSPAARFPTGPCWT